MNSKLLRELPSAVNNVHARTASLKIILNQNCGFVPGQRVYQYRRDDGVVELVPEVVHQKRISQVGK